MTKYREEKRERERERVKKKITIIEFYTAPILLHNNNLRFNNATETNK